VRPGQLAPPIRVRMVEAEDLPAGSPELALEPEHDARVDLEAARAVGRIHDVLAHDRVGDPPRRLLRYPDQDAAPFVRVVGLHVPPDRAPHRFREHERGRAPMLRGHDAPPRSGAATGVARGSSAGMRPDSRQAPASVRVADGERRSRSRSARQVVRAAAGSCSPGRPPNPSPTARPAEPNPGAAAPGRRRTARVVLLTVTEILQVIHKLTLRTRAWWVRAERRIAPTAGTGARTEPGASAGRGPSLDRTFGGTASRGAGVGGGNGRDDRPSGCSDTRRRRHRPGTAPRLRWRVRVGVGRDPSRARTGLAEYPPLAPRQGRTPIARGTVSMRSSGGAGAPSASAGDRRRKAPASNRGPGPITRAAPFAGLQRRPRRCTRSSSWSMARATSS